jgi:LacI family transcriptional regulator
MICRSSKVAKLAGVSSSTVSRVINNHPRVAPETADSVRKAMNKLGYTPSERRPGPKPASRSATGVTTVAFLVLGTTRGGSTPAFEELLRGVSAGASRNDLNLIFSHMPDPDRVPGRLLEQRVDGLLLHGAPPGMHVRDRLRRMPTVWLMGNRSRPEWGDQVLPDGFAIGELAAKYLVGSGHQHVAFLNLDQSHWSLRMYGHAFAAAATTLKEDAVVTKLESVRQSSGDYWRDYSVESVDQLVERYLELPNRPTGIFVAEDRQVAMIQPALQKRGVEVGPGAVEIVSCNNEQPYLVGLMPRPAVIDIRVDSIGQRGVEQLLWRLGHLDVMERIVSTIEPTLLAAPGVIVQAVG